MKKLFTTLFLAVLVTFVAKSQTQYFYTVIANPSKTINYDFGFYPSVMSYVEAEGVAPYTKIKAGVFNREGAKKAKHFDKLLKFVKVLDFFLRH